MDDLDSLQDASIDNDLLENHFLRNNTDESSQQVDLVAKHAKTYGYLKISEEKLVSMQ